MRYRRASREQQPTPENDGAGSASELPSRVGQVVGGYRLVRRIGHSTRSELYLGHAGPARTAALKIYNPTTPVERIGTVIEALSRASHPHTIALRDLATVDGVPCLILERLPHGSLGALQASRAELRVGEIITVLAPIAAALEAMHASGVVHGRIRSSAVLFRRSGAPVLASFGQSSLIEPGLSPAALSAHSGVRSDRAALAALARVLLNAAAGDDRATALASWLDEGTITAGDGFLDELSARLFALGGAEAVRFPDASPLVDTDHPARAVPARIAAGDAGTTPDRERAPSARAIPPRWLLAANLPEWLDPVIAVFVDGSPRAALREWVRAHARTVRTPVKVLGAAAIIAVALTLAAVLVEGRAGEGADEEGPGTPGTVTDGSAAAGVGATEIGALESAIETDESRALGDDPLAALAELLDTRERCYRELSVLCLDGVAQQDSSALSSDTALIRSVQEGGELPPRLDVDPSAFTLVERLGDSALVDIRTREGATGDALAAMNPADTINPASALVVKGEAGWRIRGYLD